MIQGYMPKQDVADILLDLRSFLSSEFDPSFSFVGLMTEQIDSKLKELK